MGGLSRRATVIKDINQSKIIVEASNWAWKSKFIAEKQLEQQRVKGELQLQALQDNQIDGIAVGTGELALGREWLSTQEGPFVLSNLTCTGDAPWERVRSFERDTISIAFVSLVGTQASIPSECTRIEGKASLENIQEQTQADIWIVSSELSQQENEALATQFSRSVFIDAKTRRMLKTPQKIGENAVLLSTGSRGKHIGELAIRLPENPQRVHITGMEAEIAQQRERYQKRIAKAKEKLKKGGTEKQKKRVMLQLERNTKKLQELPSAEQSSTDAWRVRNILHALSKSVEDDPETLQLVNLYKERIEKIGQSKEETYTGSYIGSVSCQGCHPMQYEHWSQSKHARAWDTLVQVKRSQDQDCFACHVTGAHDAKGPQSPAQAKGLENVGCESCHGAGKEHVRSAGRVNMIKQPTLNNCVQCHDGVKDEGRFNPEIYYAKIAHPSLEKGSE